MMKGRCDVGRDVSSQGFSLGVRGLAGVSGRQ